MRSPCTVFLMGWKTPYNFYMDTAVHSLQCGKYILEFRPSMQPVRRMKLDMLLQPEIKRL